jgi:hypothetical protein
MQDRYTSTLGSSVTWSAMDARTMTYEDNTFDLIIEKGTIDALVVNKVIHTSN